MASVVVCGGGLAGLVAARHLAAAGADVTVFEARETVGGRVRTRERDGFTLDRGFQVLLTAYPAVRRELDLSALSLRRFSPGAVLCSTADGTRSVLADPLRDPGSLVESALNRRVSTLDKLRTLRLRWETTRRDEETFFTGDDRTIREELAARGFSERYVENFVAPFYGGITLDRSLSSSKHVFEYTFRTLSRGATAVPADGMGAIPAQLADRARAAGAAIVTGERVERVATTGDALATDGGGDAIGLGESGGSGDATASGSVGGSESTDDRESGTTTGEPTTDGGIEPAAGPTTPGGRDDSGRRGTVATTDRVTIETTDRTVTADGAVIATDPRTARALTGVETIPTDAKPATTQYYALPEPGLDREKILLHTDGEWPNVVVPYSTVAPEYAPDGQALVAATFPGEAALDEEPAALAAETRRALAAWFPERSFDELEPIQTDQIRFAQFAQPPGVFDRLPAVTAPDGPVVLAGEYTEWSSIQGAMASGRTAAHALLNE